MQEKLENNCFSFQDATTSTTKQFCLVCWDQNYHHSAIQQKDITISNTRKNEDLLMKMHMAKTNIPDPWNRLLRCVYCFTKSSFIIYKMNNIHGYSVIHISTHPSKEICSKMEVGVSLTLWCHALVLPAPGYWVLFLNFIIFSQWKSDQFQSNFRSKLKLWKKKIKFHKVKLLKF